MRRAEKERKDPASTFGEGTKRTSWYRMLGFGHYTADNTASSLKARDFKDATDLIVEPIMLENHPADSRVKIDTSGKTQTLTSRMGTGGGNVPMLMQPVPFTQNQRDEVRELGDKAGALAAETGSHQQTYIAEPVAYNITFCDANGTRQDRPNGGLYVSETDKSGSLTAGPPGTDTVIQMGYRVRRLTPLECERLQDYPDHWTAWGINERGERVQGSDSKRYKATGNSIALPSPGWVIRNIRRCLPA